VSDELGLAALDPDRAASAPAYTPAGPSWRDEPSVHLPAARPHALTLSASVRPPPRHSRWRFFVFWCLLKLAARVYPFNFEIYREPEPGDEP
jgi:hypothetical protein